MHPADFYLGAKPEGSDYFWSEGRPVSVQVIAVRPGGERVTGVRVAGTVVRREWHQVRRERDGYSELVGEWVSDTVGGCTVTTATAPVPCRFTPPAGGTYIVSFRAADASGREVVTSFYRWATGKDWVPWNDESQFKMDVIPDRTRYSVGDTATVLFASPFTGRRGMGNGRARRTHRAAATADPKRHHHTSPSDHRGVGAQCLRLDHRRSWP